MKLSDYVFEFLSKKKVKEVFMLPGGGAMHLNDSLAKSKINYTCFLHEQAAAIAAEAYAQYTNTPGVLLVTSGPGGTNALTGVTAGWLDSTPMIIISGQAKSTDLVGDRNIRQNGSQEVPITDMVKPITKYCKQVLRPERIDYYLNIAWNEATTGRKGPVWLDIPLDIQAVEIKEENLFSSFNNIIYNEEPKSKYEVLVKLLLKSNKPLFLIGNGVRLATAEEDLFKIVKKIGIPVNTTWKALDLFDYEDEFYIGHPGIMGDRTANAITQFADLIISIGCRLDNSVTAFNEKNFGKNAKKILVDIDINEIFKNEMNIELYFNLDAKIFLEHFHQQLEIECFDTQFMEKKEIWNKWLLRCKDIKKKYPVVLEKHKKIVDRVSAYYFIEELCSLLSNRDIIVPESSGGAGEITFQAFKVKKGQKIRNAAALGSMGFGLPYAIGACIASNRERTILINGDGAFQLNIQELATIFQSDFPIIIFIWSNDGYASIRNMQKNRFNSNFIGNNKESGLALPSIRKIAEAYGLKTYEINNNTEVTKLLPEILESKGPTLCEVQVVFDEILSPRINSRLGDNGEIIPDPLERMSPYLEEDIIDV